MHNIGRTISERRKELNMTLEEVGKAIGVGKSTVLKYENGKIQSIGSDKIVPLADVLKMNPSVLLGAEAVKPVPEYRIRWWVCPNCNWYLTSMIDDGCDIPVRRDNFCAKCGKPVNWE